MYGYIAHHTRGFWFMGPLPSPDAARKLVQMYQPFQEDTLTSEEMQSLQQKWDFVGGPPRNSRAIGWVIDLEATTSLPMNRYVKQALDVLSRIEVPLFHDMGPDFPAVGGDSWVGEGITE